MSRRALCPRCFRPLSACYCGDLEAVVAPVRIALLQPAKERKHPLNTGRIVTLAVSNCDLFEGEDFSERDVDGSQAKALHQLLDQYRGRTWLLYPGENAITPAKLLAQTSTVSDAPEALLVVLDATWKKSRKMLYLCPALAALPRVTLPRAIISRYRLRKVPRDGYLSTVEAVTAVLEELGHNPQGCESMLAAFEGMIATQIATQQRVMGQQAWQNNYPNVKSLE